MPFRGALVTQTGDWAWYKQMYGVTGWHGEGPGKRCCWLCAAAKGNREFGVDASWRQTFFTPTSHTTFLLQQRYVSGLWPLPGFTIDYLVPDFMHIVCLGTLLYLEGNVMWELFVALGGRFSNSTAARARLLTLARMTARSLDLEYPFNALTVFMIRPGPCGSLGSLRQHHAFFLLRRGRGPKRIKLSACFFNRRTWGNI